MSTTLEEDIKEFREKLERIKKRKEQKAEEEARLAAENQLDGDVEAEEKGPSFEERNSRSIVVKNLDPSVSKMQLESFFGQCGKINRISIVEDRITHMPRGFAYIEFAEHSGIENGLLLNDHLMAGKNIEVLAKRINPVKSRRRKRRMMPAQK